MAIKRGRRFYGCEIKPEYLAEARKNLAAAEKSADDQMTLFCMEEAS